MTGFDSYNFLETISYERICGSEEEKKCAKYIKEQCEKLNVETVIEDFDVASSVINKCELKVNGKVYEATGVINSGSTSDEGVKTKLIYIENGENVNLLDLENKVVLVNILKPEVYKKLVESKAAGFIMMSGSVYDDLSKSDLEVKMIRERHFKYGEIPGACIRMIDACEILKNANSDVELIVKQEKVTLVSQNVIATIKGKTDDVVVFTAHYDSVRFSTGAYDNGTGSVTIFDIMQRYCKEVPEKTLKFIWCGSEEMGLLGSKAYVEAHKEELTKIQLCINVDMTGVTIGRDIAVCTSEERLVNFLSYFSEINGFALEAKQGVYSSDSTPFADNGVPAISFARISAQGGAAIHSRKDVIDFITKECMDKTTDFIKVFADTMITSKSFPVKREMPENMKKELDKYLGRDK